MSRRALITGITGQDGAHLAMRLLKSGYEVHGATRSLQQPHAARLASSQHAIRWHEYDLGDDRSLKELVRESKPHEIYHLAGPSFVPDCVEDPPLATELIGLSTVRLLETIRRFDSSIRFFHASSSEVFGDAKEVPQSEMTPFRPLNPYGVAKAFAHSMVCDYRQRHGLFACNGILFNHESEFRDHRFVTRKITSTVARIANGEDIRLTLGDLDARRDWGYAGDFVAAMQASLAHSDPSDYVIATGTQHSVREFVELAFACVGLDWQQHVDLDETFCRPGDAQRLVGDPSRAREILGWRPQTSFPELVRMMIAADLRHVGAERALRPYSADAATVQK